ncbi:MAG: LysM domain-containing protein, partial [Nocardioides sp.]
PDRAVAPPRPTPPRPPERAHAVVVRPGDSLWSIAAHDLGPGAGDAEIADRWHALYAANRGRIGPDPDLVEPGLRLLLPGKDPS